MNFSYVIFVHDDEQQESSLKRTKVFQNKNLFQCNYNNRGFCSFRDKYRYRHFRGICAKNVCRERNCENRHPVTCRFKDDCKFYKRNSCAFKHPDMRTTIVNKDLEMEMKMFVEEVAHLEREIRDLKNDINILRRMNFL